MITSLTNGKVKELVQLRDKAKERKKQDVFLVEGRKMLEEAPSERIQEVYVSEGYLEKRGTLGKLEQISFEAVSDEVFRKISDTQTPQGVLCVVKQFHYEIKDLIKKKNPCLVLLEDIQDPGNLGTIFRTGEGAGIDGIIMSKGTVDLYNPKTIRSTMGSIYRMPFFYAESLADNIKGLQKMGVSVYAAHLHGRNNYEQEDYTKGTAFLIGNEGNGLQEQTAALADTYIKIPMKGKVESLNAAVATALLMYEADRQRRK
ncbi:MAG: 23S rRNA (guanosine(2251)-2'-O)-methyltransferase RlmB [Lachnospiraceae bacterium]|nr:23S rRNA (guanosine(2251)-2'-O)-methyltransferase RlmB [Lachnospiraceae bacterium]